MYAAASGQPMLASAPPAASRPSPSGTPPSGSARRRRHPPSPSRSSWNSPRSTARSAWRGAAAARDARPRTCPRRRSAGCTRSRSSRTRQSSHPAGSNRHPRPGRRIVERRHRPQPPTRELRDGPVHRVAAATTSVPLPVVHPVHGRFRLHDRPVGLDAVNAHLPVGERLQERPQRSSAIAEFCCNGWRFTPRNSGSSPRGRSPPRRSRRSARQGRRGDERGGAPSTDRSNGTAPRTGNNPKLHGRLDDSLSVTLSRNRGIPVFGSCR